ncbi:MAG: hypothetical protein AAGJ46_20370 [Planctomycetota bacterium]
MPRLDADQVRLLLDVLGKTQDEELTCDEVLPFLAVVVEHEMAGEPLPEALAMVEHHLSICPECVEELNAIRDAIKAIDAE